MKRILAVAHGHEDDLEKVTDLINGQRGITFLHNDGSRAAVSTSEIRRTLSEMGSLLVSLCAQSATLGSKAQRVERSALLMAMELKKPRIVICPRAEYGRSHHLDDVRHHINLVVACGHTKRGEIEKLFPGAVCFPTHNIGRDAHKIMGIIGTIIEKQSARV